MARTKQMIDPDETTETETGPSAEELQAQIAELRAKLREKTGATEDEGDEPMGAPDTPPPGMVRLSDLVNVIAEGMARNAPRRYQTMGEYEPNSPMQEGLKKKELPKMTRMCFENGQLIRDFSTTPTEIKLLNQIIRPGRYIERMVEVVIREPENAQDRGELNLRYNNKRDQMDMLRNHARSFKEMLTLIIIEQEAFLAKENR